MGECSVMLAGRRIGLAAWQRKGPRCRVTVRCQFAPNVLYRAVLEADRAELPLGILIREENSFVTDRWLTPTQSSLLEQASAVCCRIQVCAMDGTVLPTEPLQESIPEPLLQPPGKPLSAFAPLEPEILSDPLLTQLARERGDLLILGDLVAMPARQGEDPVAPLFCLLEPARLGEEPWYLLGLQNGQPTFAGIRQESLSERGKLEGVMS